MAASGEFNGSSPTNDGTTQNCLTQIQSGDLDGVDEILQGMESLNRDDSHQAIREIVKYYFCYLSKEAHTNGICFSSAWDCESVKQSRVRSQVLNILKSLFKHCSIDDSGTSDDNALMISVTTHDEELIRLLLENGADPNQRGGVGDMNAFALAIILNELSVIKLLLAHNAAINKPCCEQMTPLQLSMNKSVEVSTLLMQHGAHIQQVMQMSGTSEVLITRPPLIHAVDTDSLYLAYVLLEHGEDVNQCYASEHLNFPLHIAVFKGNEDMVKLLIQYGACIDKCDHNGNTPLGLALFREENGGQMCDILLEAGCSWTKRSTITIYDLPDTYFCYPPSHIAAVMGHSFHLDFLKKLLSLESESESHKQQTSQNQNEHVSNCEEESDELAEKEQQSVINFQALDKSTALFMAVLGGNLDIAEFLYLKGADPNILSCHGNLIHAAVRSEREDVLNYVLKFRIDLDCMDDDGNTPLILSAGSGHSQMCRILVENGASLNVKGGKFGETALFTFGREEISETLICHGASLDIPDSRDTTALYWAFFKCRVKIAKLMLEAGAKLSAVQLASYPCIDSTDELWLMLKNYTEHPHSLQKCCRLSVRSHLSELYKGKSIMAAVMSLPVPPAIRDFLALRN